MTVSIKNIKLMNIVFERYNHVFYSKIEYWGNFNDVMMEDITLNGKTDTSVPSKKSIFWITTLKTTYIYIYPTRP